MRPEFVSVQRPRILVFSTLYPNAAVPQHGVFVENRLRHLLSGGQVTADVVAPSPWFPASNAAFGTYARLAKVPRREIRHGIDVSHPRFLALPKVGMTVAPALLYAGARSALRRLQRQGRDFDLIDAHYFYPDGVAAVLLGREFGKPVCITARGTDLSLIPDHALPRRMIVWAAEKAAGLVTVCQALKDRLVELGVSADRIRVLRNGVDLAQFRPLDRQTERRRLGVDGTTVVSVGSLIERKGHHLVIEAIKTLPDVTFLIAGEGPERAALEALAKRLQVSGRVRFLGQIPHDQLAGLYSAADVSVLASSREGWANVLLESLACGTPVVATNIWGTPEVIAVPEAGALVPERTAPAIAGALRGLLAALPDRAATRAYAERFSWDATAQGQLDLFREILARRRIHA